MLHCVYNVYRPAVAHRTDCIRAMLAAVCRAYLSLNVCALVSKCLKVTVHALLLQSTYSERLGSARLQLSVLHSVTDNESTTSMPAGRESDQLKCIYNSARRQSIPTWLPFSVSRQCYVRNACADRQALNASTKLLCHLMDACHAKMPLQNTDDLLNSRRHA